MLNLGFFTGKKLFDGKKLDKNTLNQPLQRDRKKGIMPLPPARQNEALEERIALARVFGENVTSYLSTANTVNSLKLELMNNRLPGKSHAELQRLRKELVQKYSGAKSSIEHSKLIIENVHNETGATKTYSGDQAIANKKAELLKGMMLAKKRIDELTNKKREIQEINKTVKSFQQEQTFRYTEEELAQIFGDKTEQIKNARGVHLRKDDETGAVHYEFRADLSHSVDQLNSIQDDLKNSIQRYENEINEIKKSYADSVAKFEKIKDIVGLVDENEKTEAEVEVEGDKDVVMREAGENLDA